ncbi:two-component system chemotaxis response regulator CheB [Flavobacterium arsenatis]|uniref:protein-glutamate methylesterase n=1 Tax=Flavobacterium arsenatis TaxID=1484332 RepID=A0ABU1TNK1_9FLAO|nr:chemotaxis protein CheB [Flavobacterium arsenatis]MDR6967540.1 two-component system chemotaxis response regulator CheB [Flavobacterium arsenatis]
MEKNKLISDCKVLIIGGSAGSLDVLLKILPHLEIPSFAIVIILHRKHTEDTTLEELIAVKTKIPVKEVEDKVVLEAGFIYIAPSDYHLLFEKNDLLSLDTSEKVNYSRPSIDVAFESASDIYGKALVGILLSGANADGTDGLIAIKNNGGTIVVQKPETADMPFMPNNAIEHTSPDYVLDVSEILEFISRLK